MKTMFWKIVIALCLGSSVSATWAEDSVDTSSETSHILSIFNGKINNNEKAIAEINREIRRIKASSGNQGIDEVAKKRIDAIEKMAAAIPKQGGNEADASMLAITKEVEILKREVEKQKVLEKKVTTLGSEHSELSHRVASLEKKEPFRSWLSTLCSSWNTCRSYCLLWKTSLYSLNKPFE